MAFPPGLPGPTATAPPTQPSPDQPEGPRKRLNKPDFIRILQRKTDTYLLTRGPADGPREPATPVPEPAHPSRSEAETDAPQERPQGKRSAVNRAPGTPLQGGGGSRGRGGSSAKDPRRSPAVARRAKEEGPGGVRGGMMRPAWRACPSVARRAEKGGRVAGGGAAGPGGPFGGLRIDRAHDAAGCKNPEGSEGFWTGAPATCPEGVSRRAVPANQSSAAGNLGPRPTGARLADWRGGCPVRRSLRPMCCSAGCAAAWRDPLAGGTMTVGRALP